MLQTVFDDVGSHILHVLSKPFCIIWLVIVHVVRENNFCRKFKFLMQHVQPEFRLDSEQFANDWEPLPCYQWFPINLKEKWINEHEESMIHFG